jgi:hypothetical protein
MPLPGIPSSLSLYSTATAMASASTKSFLFDFIPLNHRRSTQEHALRPDQDADQLDLHAIHRVRDRLVSRRTSRNQPALGIPKATKYF